MSDPGEALSGTTVPVPPGRGRRRSGRTPLYPRLLGLRHVAPNAWQRALLGEGAIAAGLLLAMADLASAWAVLVLPVAVAVVVKAHDLLQGLLERGTTTAPAPRGEPAPSEASSD